MRYLLIIQTILMMTLAASCGEKKEWPPDSYQGQIIKYRIDKDSSFKFSETSPIADSLKNDFTGLKYYEPDTNYVVYAKFILNKKPDTIQVKTTKEDDIRTMLRLGTFEFKIKGKKMKLTGYTNAPLEFPADVFIPFADKTNDKDTYEGGRYLDMTIDSGMKTVILDFNMAYAPYCAYNHKYSCPLVPFENVLQQFIRAGEKNYGKK